MGTPASIAASVAGSDVESTTFEIRESNWAILQAHRNARLGVRLGTVVAIIGVVTILAVAVFDPARNATALVVALSSIPAAGLIAIILGRLRLRDPIPEALTLDGAGLHLALSKGELKSVRWDDPKLWIHFFAGRIGGRDQRIMVAKSWGLPALQLPPDAFDAIVVAAKEWGLNIQHAPRKPGITYVTLSPSPRDRASRGASPPPAGRP
jgi:hypothetical protein